MVDSERIAVEADVEAGRRTGYPFTREIALRSLGVNRAYSIEMYRKEFGGFDPDRFYPVFDQLMEEAALRKEIHAKKGAEALLQYLAQRNMPYAVASSSEPKEVRLRLESAGLDQYFSVFATGSEVAHSKPAPDIFLLAAKKLSVRPEDCLVVEDSPNGIRAGKAGQMRVCMIPDQLPYCDAYAPYCDFVRKDLEEVIRILEDERKEGGNK